MESIETRAQFIELRAKGLSFDKISTQLKIAKKTLVGWARRYEAEVEAAKGLELEALLEKHSLLTAQKVEQFGRLLSRIDQELATRSLKEVSTDKLLDLRLKYQAAIKTEMPQPKFLSEDEIATANELEALLAGLTGGRPERKVA
jgi:transposase